MYALLPSGSITPECHLTKLFEVAQFDRNPKLFIPTWDLLEKRLSVAQFDRNGGSL
jgi:hypothetical protein